MGKNNYIKFDFEAPAYVVGVASNDRIWKLCWNINQLLDLNLASARQEVVDFRPTDIYEDTESSLDYEFAFFENNFKSRKVPKKAREFRFWFVIKLRKEKEPDITSFIRKLNQVENISLAVDLSQEKDIKSLIP